MSLFSNRSFTITAGLVLVALFLVFGLLFSDINYKNQIVLVVVAGGAVMLLAHVARMNRQRTEWITLLQRLVAGEMKQPLDKIQNDPGRAAINALYHKLHEAAEFIEKLEDAETEKTLQHVSPTESLGKALLNMKTTLRLYREDEEKRHWGARGHAYFADILRLHSDNLIAFSNQVIQHLVKYLEVNQGSFFVKTESEGKVWLEMTACYAYNRKKYVEKRIVPGQGLVGQCFLERKSMLITHVPDQYTTITSGLGEATPTTIVIVPLMWNDEVYGIVELASFKRLEDYQVTFLEKIAENIASSLATVQTGRHMRELLATSQQLTEEFEQLSLVANNTDNSVIITDKQGDIVFVNHGFVNLTGYTAEEVMGEKPGHMLQGPDTDPETVQRIHLKLQQGISFNEEILNYRKTGESYWVSITITPIKNEQGVVEQYISIQSDVTEIKQQALDYTYKLEAISRSNAVVEFDPQGIILDANDLFLDISGYRREDLLRKDYWQLLPETEIQSPQNQMMWDNLKAGTFFSGEFKQKSKLGKELWLSGTFNPIFDLENNLQKIMMFAQFTTYEKEKQNELTGTVHAFANAVQSFEMTLDGKLKKANGLFLERFGYKRREISKMELADLVEADTPLPALEAALQPEGRFQEQLSMVTKDGKRLQCHCSFASIKNLEDKVSKVVVIVRENFSQ